MNYYEPHGISQLSIIPQSQKLVWHRDAVKVGTFPVYKIRVRLPDPLQKKPVHRKLF